MTEEQEDFEIMVRTMDLTGEGFFPKYEQIIVFKDAFTNPMEATRESVREAKQFLLDHIEAPEDRDEAIAILNKLDVEGVMDLFKKISGGDKVSPQSGEESEVSSE